MHHHLPSIRATLFGVDSHNHALIAKKLSPLGNEFGITDSSGIDAHLIRTRGKHLIQIVYGAQAAPHGERNKHLISHSPHHIQHDAATLMRGSNIQKNQLVGALGIINHGLLYRITCIAQCDEIHAFDYSAIFYIKARNNAFC